MERAKSTCQKGEMWEKTEKSVKKTVEEVLGFQRKRSLNKWLMERDNTRTRILRDPSEANKR